MKLKLKITKDILKRSSMCGIGGITFNDNCAFALAFNELIPKTRVARNTYFKAGPISREIPLTVEQKIFIINFDLSTPEQRINMPEQEFDVEIPDEVIEYYYGDTVKAVQHLIDNPVLTPVLI